MEFLVAAQPQDNVIAVCPADNCGCFGLCRLSPPPPCPMNYVSVELPYTIDAV